jgi:hypothetical protein
MKMPDVVIVANNKEVSLCIINENDKIIEKITITFEAKLESLIKIIL